VAQYELGHPCGKGVRKLILDRAGGEFVKTYIGASSCLRCA
jgi:hypothetical protein